MPMSSRGNKLERWKIALIKAMVADGRWPNDQDILAYFTRPTRSINHRAIAEIRTGAKHAAALISSFEDHIRPPKGTDQVLYRRKTRRDLREMLCVYDHLPLDDVT